MLVTSRWAASAAVLAAVATGVVGTEPGEGSGAGTAVVRAEGAGTEDGAQP